MTPGLCACGCGGVTSIAKYSSTSKGWVKGQPLKFMLGHNGYLLHPGYSVDPTTGCWLYQGAVDGSGYGRLTHKRRGEGAHRAYYIKHRGPIPDGLELDHLCRVRRCVNPDHLEPVTGAVNARRGLNTRLTDGAVAEIRELAQHGHSQRRLAAAFGVSKSQVANIISGRQRK